MTFPISAMDDLALLFERMDADYQRAAQSHGFVCRGCDDNCCGTLFYHHTLVEYLYLRQGLGALPEARRAFIASRALAADHMTTGNGSPSHPGMCPLNEEGKCMLYAHRPMICRLHGIPHLLRRPDGKRQTGPGCGNFDRQCGAATAPLLDRTPLYRALAELERKLRQRLGFQDRIKLTIAGMIVQRLNLPQGET